jgi:hypothetical protein
VTLSIRPENPTESDRKRIKENKLIEDNLNISISLKSYQLKELNARVPVGGTLPH